MQSYSYDNSRTCYKPTVMRTPVLLFLLLLTLFLIALTEIACRTIPAHAGLGKLGNVVNTTISLKDRGLNHDPRDVTPVPILLSLHSGPTPAASSRIDPPNSTPSCNQLLAFRRELVTSLPVVVTSTPTPTPTSTPTTIDTQTGPKLNFGSYTLSHIKILPIGGWLLAGDGSTSTPDSQASSIVPVINGPVQGPAAATATTSLPNLGVNDPPPPSDTPAAAPTGPSQAVPVINSSPPPTEDPAPPPVDLNSNGPTAISGVIQTPDSGPVKIQSQSLLTVPIGNDASVDVESSTPTPILVVANGKTSTFIPPPQATAASETAAPILVVIDGVTSSIAGGQLMTNSAGSFLPITTVVGGKTLVETPSPVLTVVNGQTFTAVSSPFLTTIDGQTFTEVGAGVPSETLTVINGQTFTEVGAAVPATPSASGHLANGGSIASPTHKAVQATSTFANSTGTYIAWSNGATTDAPRITRNQYFLVSFFPLIISAFYIIPWRILDSTIREMEPFYQLSQPGGATAENSLCLDYGTSFLLFTPVKAMLRGHFIVFWSSLISLAVLILAPLSSEAFFVSLSGICGVNLDSADCLGAWGVYPKLARMIEGVLSFVAVLLVLIIIFNYRRTTGIHSEPLSIVGLASLFYKSPLLRSFKEINSRIKNKDLKKLLEGKRFAISEFKTMDQMHCYGIVPLDSDFEAGFSSAHGLGKKSRYSLLNTSELTLANNQETTSPNTDEILGSTSRMSRLWWNVKEKLYYLAAFLVFAGLLTMIMYYFFAPYDENHISAFEKYMDSQGCGVRFMLTALGVAVKLFWSNTDQNLRKHEPYHRLLAGSSSPEDSILLPPSLSPFSAIIPSLKRRHYLVALICFVSLLSEFLPICLANTVYSPAVTEEALYASNYACMIVLSLMILSILLLMFTRRSIRPLPRKPDTLASVGLYVATQGVGEESMLNSFRGLSWLSRTERDGSVSGLGRLYSMGVVEGDGLRIDDDRRIVRLWSE